MAGEIADLNKVVNAFTTYKFIKQIITPFKQMDAYRLGIIDGKGNFLRKYVDLKTSEEKKAGSMFNRLIINLKKIIAKVPDPKLKAQLKTLPTAILLIREEIEKVGGDGEEFLNSLQKFVVEEYDVDLENLFLNESFQNHENIIAEPIDCVFGVPIYRIDGEVVSSLELSSLE